MLGRLRGGHSAGEQRAGHDAGQERLGGGHFKRSRGAQQEGEDKDHLAGHVAGQATDGQGQGNQRLQGLADSGDPAAFIAIRHVPGVQHEQHARHELHQADQAQVQDVAGQLVEVPADRHGEHLEAAGGKDPRQPERDERAVVT